MSINNNLNKEFSLICLFYLLLVSILIFCGFFIGNRYGRKNKVIESNINDTDKQSNMPYFPNFPPGKGVLIYPDKGILIIKFPKQIEITVKEEGCK